MDRARSLLLDVTLLVLAPAHLLIMLATVPFPAHPTESSQFDLRAGVLLFGCLATAAAMAFALTPSRKNSNLAS